MINLKLTTMKFKLFLTALAFIALSIGPSLITAQNYNPDPKTSEKYVKFLKSTKNYKGSNYFVHMKESTDKILTEVKSMKFSDRPTKSNYVISQLKSHASTTQNNILTLLEKLSLDPSRQSKFSYKSMWLTNSIILTNPDVEVIVKVLQFDEVITIIPDTTYRINPTNQDNPDPDLSIPKLLPKREGRAPFDACKGKLWNFDSIGVNSLPSWIRNNPGVTMAVLDTGITTKHECFAGNKIIPVLTKDSQTMEDDHGHGTHVAGVMANMAPQATMYVGKVLDKDGYGDTSGIMQHWETLCELGKINQSPVVCGQSFGSPYLDIYMHYGVEAMHACGIVMVAAMGNSGCGGTAQPGNEELVYGVGSYDSNYYVSEFSSYGPENLYCEGVGQFCVAPGGSVCSSWLNNGYAILSGTSMSTPHVTAAWGIVQGMCPTLNEKGMRELLADCMTNLTLAQADNCGFGKVPGARYIDLTQLETKASSRPECQQSPP